VFFPWLFFYFIFGWLLLAMFPKEAANPFNQHLLLLVRTKSKGGLALERNTDRKVLVSFARVGSFAFLKC
jgi:hypothetical protein